MRDPINFKDHVVEHPGRFEETDLGEGLVQLEPSPGTVIQQGTPLNASNMNKVDLSALEGNMIGLLYASILRQLQDMLLSENKDQVLASAEKITFTPEEGESWSTFNGCWYYKIGSRVHLHVAVTNLTANTNVEVYALPKGFWPCDIVVVAGRSATGSVPPSMWVLPDGTIKVSSPTISATADIEYDAFS